MAGPWEKYQTQSPSGPWEKYGAPPPSGDGSQLLSQKYTGGNARQSKTADVMDTVANFGENAWQGAKGAVSGAVDLGKDLASNPNWMQYQPAGQRPSTFQKFVGDPADATFAKARDAYGKGRYSEAAGYGAASALPFAGPWAAGLGEQAGAGDISGAFGQLVGGLGAAKLGERAATAAVDIPKTATEFHRRATSLNDVTQAGAGVYQGVIQPLVQTLRGAIQNEGAKTIQQAIDADKAATTVQGRGTISPSTAVAAAAQAIEQTGHLPSPQTQSLLNRLNNASFLTLEDAKNLRSDFGGAASKADRTGNAKLGKVLWTAYDELGDGMKGRIQELQGTTKPFEHYNNEFKAYYELNKGIAGSMQDSIMDRHESIPKLKEWQDADLSEIKDQAKKYGMDPDKFDEAQKNAKSVVAAHDSISGKYNKSLYRLVMSGGSSGAAVALPLAVYAAAHGAGLYGLAPLLLASYVGAKIKGLEPEVETGRILRKLNVDPEKFQVRTPVQGPQNFTYPNQDELYGKSLPPVSGGAPDQIDVNTDRWMQQVKDTLKNQPKPQPGMGSQAQEIWQQSIFNKQPAPDIGAKARQANPEPTRAEVKGKAEKINAIRARAK